MNSLVDKRCFVTAGTQGIGRAITLELLRRGARVVAHYFHTAVDPSEITREAQVSEDRLMVLQGDLRRQSEAALVTAQAITALGGLEVLINNAGSLIARHNLDTIEPDFWQDSVDLNLSSMAWVTQAAQSALVKAGASSVVNLASLAGRKGGHGGSLAYSTMKGAVLTWTRALSAELGPSGVRVNAVAPGLILGTSFHRTHTTDESARATVAGIPLGRAGSPEDVARAAVFLASEYGGFITGATLDINGGVYCA